MRTKEEWKLFLIRAIELNVDGGINYTAKDDAVDEILAEIQRAVAEEREKNCRAVCNSCRTQPVFFKEVYSEKKFWVHDEPYSHDCGAAQIYDAIRRAAGREGKGEA